MTEHQEGDQLAGADSDANPERRPDRVRVSSAPHGLVFALVTSHYVHLPGHAHPPGAQVRVEQIAALLPPDRWDVVVAERRVHIVRRPGSPDHIALHGVVVRATRTSPAQA